MNIVRKVTGILLIVFVVSLPIWFSSGATEILSSRNGRSSIRINTQSNTTAKLNVTVSAPVVPSLSPAVRDLPPYEQKFVLNREVNPRMNNADSVTAYSKYEGGLDPLLVVQLNAPDRAIDTFDTPIVNINGQEYTGSNPPDTVGDVGINHYIQAVNGSGSNVQIYDKTGSPVGSMFSLDSLGSGNCATGLGDPIILYDRLADRWMLTEFSNSGNQLCVYISQTADPTGAYYNYAFTAVNSFPDYPKYGVWPDAYYVGTNEDSSNFYALDRNSMLAGDAAAMQNFAGTNLPGFGFQMIIPSDLDGETPPPIGSPNYFMRHRDTENHGQGSCPAHEDGDCLEIFEFTVDWTTPANSEINGPTSIKVTEFDSDLCGLTSFYCFPQPGSSTTLDPLREVVMNRLQYRNFETHEVLIGNLVTDVDGNDHGGIRWFELRKSGTDSWSLYQEGTYAPDASHRWMGAAAMDGSGNIAVGYNVSDATAVYPSLRYIGRLKDDPIGTMPQGEYSIATGSSPNGSNRYGDYSAMSVDPADDCTFWFTGMYNTSTEWSTRIASFKFDSCTGVMSPGFRMETTPAILDICSPNDAEYTVDLTSVGGFVGDVALSAPSAPGTAIFTPITVTLDAPSTLTISDTAVGSYTFDIIGTGVATPTLTRTNTINLDLFSTPPNVLVLIAPANETTDAPTSPTFSWNALSDATSYDIKIATDADFLSIVDSATVTTNNYSSSITLNTNTTYYWRVRANNSCGNGTYSATFRFNTLATPSDCGEGTTTNIIYSEDFEDGTDIWTHGGDGDTWSISTARANSGNYSYYAENVDSVSNQQIESPDVTLPKVNSSLNLQFWNWQMIEDFDTGCYDGAVVEISTNGGAVWTQLENGLLTDPYDGIIDGQYDNPLDGMNGWCGDSQGWLNSIIDLDSYAGETVRFRFSLGTDTTTGYEGWYIDDFKVQSCTTVATNPVIQINPVVLTSTQAANTQTEQILTIGNVGTAVLDWNIFEDSTSSCKSINDTPWIVGLPTVTNTITPDNEHVINVLFDSTGMDSGTYNADLCIESNDVTTPQLIVPVTMNIDTASNIYLPIITTPPIPVSTLLTPFDANEKDINGPSSWSANYGKTPEIIVSSNGVELDVLAQDYDEETEWDAVLLHIKPIFSGYGVTNAITNMPMLDRVMGLASDGAGNRYYAVGVDESGDVDSSYPPLDTYRNDIVRVIKVNVAGDIQFNIDLDTARHAYDNDAEMIINPMTASTSRLAVGGDEVALVHGINTSPDWNIGGARHQKAVSTRLNANNGDITHARSIWVSHSFDQRLLYDGSGIIEQHLGDAYPRQLVFGREHLSYPLFYIKGAVGENLTATRLGNAALIENDSTYGYIALFSTESTPTLGGIFNSKINGARNLAIVRVNESDNSIDPNLPDSLVVTSAGIQQTNRLRWLTVYSNSSNLHAERPKLVSIGNDRYIVLWEEWMHSDGFYDNFNGIHGMVIDDEGNILHGSTLITNEHHLHRGDDAFLLDGRAAWMTGNAENKELYLHFVDDDLDYQIITVY